MIFLLPFITFENVVKDADKSVFISDVSSNMAMLQYLVEMGMQGNHLLFEPKDIRRAFNRDISELSEIDSKTVGEVNRAIQQILEIEDITDKRDFIRDLEPILQDIIIHLYFQMIDRTMFQGGTRRH